MVCSLPGFSVHRICQARVLEWVAISFSRGCSRPRDWTRVSCIAGRGFTLWATVSTQENQTSQAKEFSVFYVWEDARVWTHWSHSFDVHLRSLGPGSCVFTTWVPQGLLWGVAVVWWLLDGRCSFLPESPQGSPAHYLWWLQLLRIVTFFVHWYGRKYSISQYYFHFMDKVTEVKQSQKTW